MTGILIVTHNSADYIAQSLEAVLAARGPGDRVLVIDNHSTDDTVQQIRRKNFEGVELIASGENKGFAGAVNLGFREFGGAVTRVLLLNPDVILRTSIAPLAEACDQYGLAAGRLMDAVDGKIQAGFSVRRFPTPLTLAFETLGINKLIPANTVNRRYRCLTLNHEVPSLVEQPAGAMLMIRTDVWNRLNGFDESFFPVWFEDVDFCVRAAKAGFQAAYVPSVEGVHAGGHSVNLIPESRRRLYWYASLLRYSGKHFRGLGRLLVGGGVLIAGLARCLAGVFQLDKNAAASWWKVARMGFASCMLGSASQAATIDSPAQEIDIKVQDQESTAEAVIVRGTGGSLDSSAINNTERALKRLHAR